MSVRILRDPNNYVHNLYMKNRKKMRAAIEKWLHSKQPQHFTFTFGGKTFAGLVTQYASQPHVNDRFLTVWSHKGQYVSGVNLRLEKTKTT